MRLMLLYDAYDVEQHNMNMTKITFLVIRIQDIHSRSETYICGFDESNPCKSHYNTRSLIFISVCFIVKNNIKLVVRIFVIMCYNKRALNFCLKGD
jgi:hypothetical protein